MATCMVSRGSLVKWLYGYYRDGHPQGIEGLGMGAIAILLGVHSLSYAHAWGTSWFAGHHLLTFEIHSYTRGKFILRFADFAVPC
jgi:hypothetical protein